MPSPDQFRSVLPASIETSRLTLRLLTEEDAAAVHRYRGQPDITRFLSHGVLTEEETAERIRHSIELARVSTAEWFMVPWALVHTETGQLIGDARTWNSNEMSGDGNIRLGTVPKDHALMGYVLDPDQHGKGLGREAAGAMVTWLFAERKTSSILAAVYEANLASLRLLTGLGFVQDLFVPASVDRHGKNLSSVRMRLDRQPGNSKCRLNRSSEHPVLPGWGGSSDSSTPGELLRGSAQGAPAKPQDQAA